MIHRKLIDILRTTFDYIVAFAVGVLLTVILTTFWWKNLILEQELANEKAFDVYFSTGQEARGVTELEMYGDCYVRYYDNDIRRQVVIGPGWVAVSVQ